MACSSDVCRADGYSATFDSRDSRERVLYSSHAAGTSIRRWQWSELALLPWGMQ